MVKNEVKNNVITAVGTSVILGIIGFFGGVFEKGAAAINEDQIVEVLNKTLVTPGGKTHGARIAEMHVELATMETRVSILQADVSDLEEAALVLTRP